MGLVKEQCAESRKGHQQYCGNQVWMKNGGRIPWNVTAICETFKISCLMGRHHMKGVLENLLKDQSFPFGSLVEYYLCFCERPIETTSIWSKSLARYVPWICVVSGRESGKETSWSQTLKNWRRWTQSEIHARRLNAKEVLTPQRSGNFIFAGADGTVKNFWRRSENIHLYLGQPSQRRRTIYSTRRIRRVFFNPTTSLIMIWWWSQMWRRLKNHSLFHWNTLTLPELPTRR